MTGIDWSRDGRLLVSAAKDGSAVLWNVETNAQVLLCYSRRVHSSLLMSHL